MNSTFKNKTVLKRITRKFLQTQESSIIIVTILYMGFVACINPVFISGDNLLNVLKSTGYTLITVVGMAMILITGGLDLSVGSTLALGGIVTGLACTAMIPVPIAIVMGVATGTVIGFINGYVIVKAGVPPLIMSLGMMYAVRGLVSVLTLGVPIYPLPKELMAIDQINLVGIPMVVIVALVVAAIGHITLSGATFGRAVYALGGNAETARICGINTSRVMLMVYVITGSLAALSGVFMAARLGSAEAAVGTGYELKVICGAVIGGVSTFGGIGSIVGATIGALFMEILTNSLTLMRVSVYWQGLVVGIILILAVLSDQYRRRLILKNSIKSKE